MIAHYRCVLMVRGIKIFFKYTQLAYFLFPLFLLGKVYRTLPPRVYRLLLGRGLLLHALNAL